MTTLDRIARSTHNAVRQRRETLLRRGVPALQRTGLLVPAFRAYERIFSLTDRRPPVDEHNLPLPPAYLRMLVSGVTSPETFINTGRVGVDSLRELFGEAGMDLDRCDAVLDFGCGCGRIARWWPSDATTEWHGTDINPRLLAWCAQSLPHLRVSANALEPPTTYRDGRFDAVYALSVFTHWPEPLQYAWMRELTRIVGPGGRLLFTTHGESAARRVLLPEERERFERGEFVERFGEDAGSNLCSAFHPEPWVRDRLAADLDVVLHRPGGAPGLGDQDVWIVAPGATLATP
jgi:SAM-dependent methyltransferase